MEFTIQKLLLSPKNISLLAIVCAGGIIEASICYTGDVLAPRDGKYTMDYYLDLARRFVEMGAHVRLRT